MFSGTRATCATGCGVGERRRGEGHRHQRLRPRLGRPSAAASVRRADRQAVGPAAASGSATRSATAPERRRGRPLRAADAGDRRRPGRAGRHGRAARRAHPARRAGPADQPAPGRRPPGDLRLALRRGAEGGHPGDAGRRLRHRRSTSARPPRSASSGSTGTGAAVEIDEQGAQPVPGHRRAAGRAGPGRHRRRVPAGGRARLDAVRVLQGGRGDRPRDAAPGPARLAGPRLRGHDDALRLLAAAEPRARRLRQEHVEHGRGLPLLTPLVADGRAAAGRHHGARADAPLPAGDPGRHVRAGAAGALARCAAVPRTGVHWHGEVVPAGRRDPGGPGARAGAAAAGADPRRGRAGVRVRPLPAGAAARSPSRPRTDHDPLNRKEYLLHVVRRVTGA